MPWRIQDMERERLWNIARSTPGYNSVDREHQRLSSSFFMILAVVAFGLICAASGLIRVASAPVLHAVSPHSNTDGRADAQEKLKRLGVKD